MGKHGCYMERSSGALGVVGQQQSEDQERLEARDRRAVVALKRGDIGALDYLYVRYADEVVALVRGVVRDHHEAEDIAHGVFVKLPRACRTYAEREVPFRAWLLRVARNAALDHVRARRQIPVEEVQATSQGVDADTLERSGALREALARLPLEQRLVLAMRHITGMTPGEIAQRLGKSESAIHGLHHRGRAALKRSLIELGARPTIARKRAVTRAAASQDARGRHTRAA